MPLTLGDPTEKKKPPPPTPTADQIAASLAANPQASTGAYMGSPMGSQIPGGMGPAAPQAQSDNNPFATNPAYLAALAAEQAGSQQADAALRAAQEAAIVGYGDPSIAKALGIGEVSSNTEAAARANTLAGNSTFARIGRARDQSQTSLGNNLAAHGIVRSGELGYQTGEIGKNYGNSLYDAQQQVLATLTGASNANVQSKQQLHQRVIDALMGAYDQSVANPGLYGAAGVGMAGPPGGGGSLPTSSSLGKAIIRPSGVSLPSGPVGKPIVQSTVSRSRFYRPPQIH